MKSGYEAWFNSSITPSDQYKQAVQQLISTLVINQNQFNEEVYETAVSVLQDGIKRLFGKRAEQVYTTDRLNTYIKLATIQAEPELISSIQSFKTEEGYTIFQQDEHITVLGASNRGLLYGVYHLIRLLQSEKSLTALNIFEEPRNSLRMINHWDNMDGSIERGYAGRSIFFADNKVLADNPRIVDYAKLMASIGINGIAINNVNVHRPETFLITEQWLPAVQKIAAIFRKYGIKLFLCANYASTIELGVCDTSDPLDVRVQAWWKEKANEIYQVIPDFGGFVIKADSENRPGPFTYGRDHADGANMIAEALEPHGGIVLWRCFVYNCHQDWRDRSTDRARAAYDHFKPLDGRFKKNVVLQIKNGPMDFQVREGVSPLFGAMPQTNQMMEFQITQEYTGQQRDICFLIPQWKEILDFETYVKGEGSTIKRIAAGEIHPYTLSGITAVTNIGDDDNWTGHHLAQANLYGYGRLVWNPELTSETIVQEWTTLTFGTDEQVQRTINQLLLESWSIYESYTSPLGVGWMVTPHYHYGPDIDGYEYSKWGTYHFADHKGIGVDRTVATGTGYSGQYEKPNADLYENLETCPDELLLFFHHVPYRHQLKSGKTVIQHIYDTHFAGVERLQYWITEVEKLKGKVDEERLAHIINRMKTMQLENAKQWRDIVNTYFFRKSGIADERGRTIY